MITWETTFDENKFKEINEKLTPKMALHLGEVYGTYLKNKGNIIIGNDFHPNSKIMKLAFTTGLLSTGINVFDVSEISTPVLKFIIRKFKFNNGIIFFNTNDLEEKININAYENDGIEFSSEKYLNLYEKSAISNVTLVSPSKIGKILKIGNYRDIYQRAIILITDKENISRNKLRIIIDCNYGPIGNVLNPIFKELKIDIILLNANKPDLGKRYRKFTSIRKVFKLINALNADLGVIFEANGEKALFLDENGNFIDSYNLIKNIEFTEYIMCSDTILTTLKLCELIAKNK